MNAVPTLLSTTATAAVTAVLTTWITGMIITPRLDARKTRILAAHKNRDQFSNSLLTILGSCGRLMAFEIPPETPDPLRTALAAERQRWLKQLDDAICWLVDNTEHWAGTYLRISRLGELASRYAADARGIMISERSENDKVEIILWITSPVQEIFFARGFFRRLVRARSLKQHLIDRLEHLEHEQNADENP